MGQRYSLTRETQGRRRGQAAHILKFLLPVAALLRYERRPLSASPTDTKAPSRPQLPGASWSLSGFRAGAVAGAVLGGCNQLALAHGPELAPGADSTARWFLGALSSTALTAGITAFLLTIAARATAPLLARPRVRSLLPWWIALITFGFSAVYLLSVGLRAMSGAYLSHGAVQFGLNGNAHLFGAALDGFRLQLLGLVACCSLLAAAVAWHMRRALARASRVRRWELPAVVASAGLFPFALGDSLASESPEAAFAASLLPPTMSAPAPSGSSAATRPILGPPRESAQRWPGKLEGGRPNVLLLMLESVPAHRVGYMGYGRRLTPELDELASRSLVATRTWATSTHSNYAQMALLSSLFPRRGHGLDLYKHLDYPRVLFHDAMHGLGYSVAAISSQDERWQGMLRFQLTDTPVFRWHAPDHPGPHLDIGSELAAPDHVTVARAISWIAERQGAAWATTITLQATHFPYRLPPGEPEPLKPNEPQRGLFNYLSYPASDKQVAINRFDNALSYVDRQIGALKRYLRETDQLDDTLWVITSDHGEMFFEHDGVTHGKTLFEPEARVPLLFHWPRGLTPKRVDDPVSHLDVLPTIVDLLGAPPHPAFQGRSILEDGPKPRPVYMNIQGLRTSEGLVCYPWKLVVDHASARVRLHRLDTDPGETRDLARERVRTTEALRRTLGEQIRAQHAYYGKNDATRRAHFAPRLLPCPATPVDVPPGVAHSPARPAGDARAAPAAPDG